MSEQTSHIKSNREIVEEVAAAVSAACPIFEVDELRYVPEAVAGEYAYKILRAYSDQDYPFHWVEVMVAYADEDERGCMVIVGRNIGPDEENYETANIAMREHCEDSVADSAIWVASGMRFLGFAE